MFGRQALRIALVRLGFALGRIAGPPQARVVLATFHADSITGNLAFIRAELERRRPPIQATVLAHAPRSSRRGLVRAAVFALRTGYHLARARVFIIDDFFFPMYAVKPPAGTTYVQVWHACGAFKKFGYSILDKRFGQTEEAVRRQPIHTNYDLCLVSAMRFAPAYSEAFRQPISKFESRFGIPRTDAFFNAARRPLAEREVRQRYGLRDGVRVILYAPTFRGDSVLAARTPEDLDLAMLQRALGHDHVVLLRRHPFVRGAKPLDPALHGFVIDASDHPDINDLMLVSDVLVTDYSSAIFEFSLLTRPMAFFAPDRADYDDERGFYFDFAAGAPGPIFETTEALAAYLRAADFDLERVARFREESFDVADGHATERFVDQIVLEALR